MKKILILSLILLITLSGNASAQNLTNNFEFSAGNFRAKNEEKLTTTIFSYSDKGGNTFLPFHLRLISSNKINRDLRESYNTLDFIFYNELKDTAQGKNYVGLGFKSFNKDEKKAKTSSYSIPLIFKTKQQLASKVKFIGNLSFFPVGKYSIKSDSLNYQGNFSGYGINLHIKNNLTNTFAIKGGYIKESYNFGIGRDNHDKQVKGYKEGFNGIYFGGEISF